MPRYEIIYAPNGVAERAGLETEVEAERYHVDGRFVTFFGPVKDPVLGAKVLLRIAATQVLQVKTVDDEDD